MNTINSVTGVILAGGKNKRMGEDKAFIRFSGRPLIETLIDKLSVIFRDLIIVTNKPYLYEKYGIKVHVDILKDRGSLGGIYTGLRFSKSKYNFIMACDMPFLNESLIRHMLEGIDGYDAVIAQRSGRLHPLCAVYSKDCIMPIESAIGKNNLRIRDFLKSVKVKIVQEKDIMEFDLDNLSFANINTPQDYRRLKKISIIS